MPGRRETYATRHSRIVRRRGEQGPIGGECHAPYQGGVAFYDVQKLSWMHIPAVPADIRGPRKGNARKATLNLIRANARAAGNYWGRG
jgi:hypothetical protein